jgi:threonine dehydrogenase-like Zn-dependent dehydrogenase
MHIAGAVHGEEREDPRIITPTDAVIRLSATCICGSDLWPYRGSSHRATPNSAQCWTVAA